MAPVLIPRTEGDAIRRVLGESTPASLAAQGWARQRSTALALLDRGAFGSAAQAERVLAVLVTARRSALASMPPVLWEAEVARLIDWAEDAADELSGRVRLAA